MRGARVLFVSVVLAAAAVAGVTVWGGSSWNSSHTKQVVADLGWNAAGSGR